MEIKIENLKMFLEANGFYNWQGFACKESDYLKSFHEYRFNIAKNFDEDVHCGDYLNKEVFLFFGSTPFDASRIFISENDENVEMFQITNYRFIVYKKEKNTESCGFGDYDYVPYVWKKDKDLSREWIKHLIKTVPNYKEEILKILEEKKLNINKNLNYKLTDIDKKMKNLSDEQNVVLTNSINEIKKLSDLENYVYSEAELTK